MSIVLVVTILPMSQSDIDRLASLDSHARSNDAYTGSPNEGSLLSSMAYRR